MNVSIGPRWKSFIADAIETGRYGSASEVVREGLRLVEEREAKLQALREALNAAIEEGGAYTDEDVASAIDDALDEMDAREAASR